MTPLHLAAWNPDEPTDIAEMLLLHGGAEVDARDDDQQTPLFGAASWGHSGIVELLILYGAEVNACDNDQERTPLQVAGSTLDIAAQLLQCSMMAFHV